MVVLNDKAVSYLKEMIDVFYEISKPSEKTLCAATIIGALEMAINSCSCDNDTIFDHNITLPMPDTIDAIDKNKED